MTRPHRSAAVIAGVAGIVVAALLSGCGLGAAGPEPTSAAPTPSASPTPSATEAPKLPDGVLARITATLRKQSGAELTVRMTVRAPVAWNSTAGAPIASRIAQTCAGELDDAAFAAGDDRFLPVELVATTVQGTWGGTAVGISPQSADAATGDAEGTTGIGLVASGAATQIAAAVGADPGSYVPHCAQPAVLTGAGVGEVDLAYASDVSAAEPAPWIGLDFGVGVAPTTDGSAPVALTVVDCEVVGAPASDVAGDWEQRETATDGTPACLARPSA